MNYSDLRTREYTEKEVIEVMRMGIHIHRSKRLGSTIMRTVQSGGR